MKRILMALVVATGVSLGAASTGVHAQGTLRVTVGTTLNQLDPARTTIGDEYVYVHLVFNGLTRIEHDMQVKPDLAQSWTASPDLKSWTFKLRPNVKFHHGRTLDSGDVVATFKRIMDPATGSNARSNLTMIQDIVAVDPLTVRFDLNIPYAGFADIFGDRQFRIVAKDRIDALSTSPVGTGPFTFKSWAPGDRMELVKNPNYFEKGLPKLDAVTIRIIPEPAARLAALESGAIDVVWNLPYEAVEQLKTSKVARVDSVATATWDGVVLNNTKPPFNDVRVRKALAMTLDKPALVELAVFGQGVPTHSPIPPSHPYFNKSLPIRQPDIAGAKKLLAEAGYPNGFDVTMQVPQEREQRVRVGVAVRDMAKAAGIRINVERVPFATYSSQVAGKSPIYVDGYFARPTIDTALYPFFHSDGSWSKRLWIYKDARVDEILDQARMTNDDGKRKALFERFQVIVDETVPGLFAYNAAHVNGVRREVQNFKSTPMQWLELKEVSVSR